MRKSGKLCLPVTLVVWQIIERPSVPVEHLCIFLELIEHLFFLLRVSFHRCLFFSLAPFFLYSQTLSSVMHH
jgi:hypothetical protein